MKKRGFTLIELLAVIVILAIIAMIATPIVLGIIDDSRKNSFKESGNRIVDAAETSYSRTILNGGTPILTVYTYTSGVEKKEEGNILLEYSGAKPQNGTIIINEQGKVTLSIHDGTYCVQKRYNEQMAAVTKVPLTGCAVLDTVYTDDNVAKGVNRPKLTTGMTPIKWNTSTNTWVETTIYDSDWYSYDTTNKKWANARTADGSMWVWIPRYAYRIASNYHTSTEGTVEVEFLKGNTNETYGGQTISTSIPTYTGAVQNALFVHPGFSFGTTELTGMWVAKFEATANEGVLTTTTTCDAGDNTPNKTVSILPNKISWRCVSPNNVFTAIRNMETNSRYGWGLASGLIANGTFTNNNNNIDTHLMKNIEWGAITYLSKSAYGKNTNEVWINPANNYQTGCAGDSASSVATTGCTYTYDTTKGGYASTTGNIYGVYDMNGDAWEIISAYLNNNDGTLDANGKSIKDANAIYKDTYSIGATDTSENNYLQSINKKGEAIYETSNSYNLANGAWFGDYVYMPMTVYPWILRGGYYDRNTSSGLFAFARANGSVSINSGFRPILVVGQGL